MQPASIKIFHLARGAAAAWAMLAFVGLAKASSFQVCQPATKELSASLDGTWAFKYLPSLDAGADAGFTAPAFDVSAWKTIRVPANWELQGFAEPGYDLKELKDGLGLYRRTFRVPAAWRGDRRVILRFDGVAYGFDLWINGKKVGASVGSAYDRNNFDITDAILPGVNADNVLAVQVTTKPFGYQFDTNDDWDLSGIYRDVTLFSVPATYVQDLSTSTRLTTDGGATLSVSVTANRPGASFSGRLVSPDGQPVGDEFALHPMAGNRFEASVPVAQPRLWTAETPSLYNLQLTLCVDGRPLETIQKRIGLREITIKGDLFLLNGRPIKLRGVNHHDIDPVDGRAITDAEMRRDLDLMKKGNINFIRTSHYPPNPRFLDLCDEMGFYVMDEVPVGSRGDKQCLGPDYLDNMLARTDGTVLRDKNHASVIIWSIGNENPMSDNHLACARHAKELDASRPVCFPQTPSIFAATWQKMPAYMDVFSPHYPTNDELREQAKTLNRPTIYSEYVHAWGLGFDRLETQWDIMQATPQFTGGAIWHFQDQGLLRTVEKAPKKDLGSVWLDKTHFYDTAGAGGCDGIVYSDRTPQTDFWETRKVYAPVQIAEHSEVVKPGPQEIALTIENRYDFRSLAGVKLLWSLQRNGGEIQQGEIPLHAIAHGKETVQIPVQIPADAAGDVLALNVRCVDEKALQITERAVRLDLGHAQRGAWVDALKVGAAPDVRESESAITVTLPQWVLSVARASGELTVKDRSGNVLVAGIYPHCGRTFIMNDLRAAGLISHRGKGTDIWQQSVLTKLESPVIKVEKQDSSVLLTVSGSYPRPEKPKEALTGGYHLKIAPTGAIAVSYDYALPKSKSYLLEAGLTVVAPAGQSEFRWIGQGPYPAYPGKERLDEFGIFHLNREDLYFQGNRRGTELALLTTPAGAGVALSNPATDVAVQREGEQTYLSQNAVISGLGNKGALAETIVNVAQTPRIAGKFTLVPLSGRWPAILTRWFGDQSATVKVFHPFYRSYDQ